MLLFWEHGFDGTGIQDICRATGLNPGSVYAAFGDKRELFLRSLQRFMAMRSQQIIAELDACASGLTAITNYLHGLTTAMLDGRRRWGCLVTNSIVEFSSRDPDVSAAFRLHLERLEATLASAIERSRQAGEIRADVCAADGAIFLMCLIQGLNVMAKTQPSASELNAVVRLALASLQQ
ncbi:TetR/AcrR family transcriptional regulator [Enterobacter hormaechei]|uniref:TetR/AcrR family transcriptional regulator n=1 Tax=Enterobacter hormaechei TaxID=158836 RepID=UPI003751B2CB